MIRRRGAVGTEIMFRNLLRAALLLTAFSGLLIFLAGLMATLGGALIALPGLGIIVSGPFLLLAGALLTGAALIALRALNSRQTYL